MSRLFVGVLAAGLITIAVPMEAGASVSVKQQWALSGFAAGDLFGFDTALQGNTLVVGDAYHSGTGAVFVYAKVKSNWVKEATLTGKDSVSGDGFGNAVALEGTTLVVGAQGHNGARGAVYVFTGSGKSWTQKQELTVTSSGNYGQFGWSVAISGSTIVAAAPNVSGAAFVFTKSGTGAWTMRKQLTASDEVNGDGFGYTLAINGSTLFVGSPYHGATDGSVYVFTGAGTSWKQRTEFRGKDTVAGDNFGVGELVASGSGVLVGAPSHATGAGAAYVFTGSGGSWKQQAELKGKDTKAGDHFGFGGAIDGSTVVVGADRHAPGGVAYVFTRSGKTWKQQAEFKGKDTAAGDAFGRWVSLSVAGSTVTAAVGAPEHATNVGRVYIFRV